MLTCEQSNSFQTFLLHSHVGKTSYDAGVLYSDAACDVEMCGCCISTVVLYSDAACDVDMCSCCIGCFVFRCCVWC